MNDMSYNMFLTLKNWYIKFEVIKKKFFLSLETILINLKIFNKKN